MGEISRDMAGSKVGVQTGERAVTRDTALQVWVWFLTLGALGLCLGLFEGGYRVQQPAALGLLAALAFAAEHEGIQVTPNIEVTIASLVCVFAAVSLGPLSGALVAAVGLLRDLPRRDTDRPILRWATWTSIRVIATASAGLAAHAVGTGPRHDFLEIFVVVTAAFAVEALVSLVLICVAPAIRRTSSVANSLRTIVPTDLAGLPLHVPMVAILVYVYAISPWSVALFAMPALAAQRLLILYRKQRDTTAALETANHRLARANLSFATALVATLDARDRYTAGHSTAVAIYARDIAKRMSLSEREQELAHLCGLVHDVGKIGLPAGLLEKPGALTLEERRAMERHSVIGEEILRNVDDYGEIAEIVRSHHERIDGTGYPDQLPGEQIPILARIIAVADAYNAMTSDRPYRDAMPSRVARLRLAQAVESQFDTSVVAAFEAILATATEAYRLGHEDAFSAPAVTTAHSESDATGVFPQLAEVAG
jgi:putative nucleotidyltransferase with HDIG domain